MPSAHVERTAYGVPGAGEGFRVSPRIGHREARGAGLSGMPLAPPAVRSFGGRGGVVVDRRRANPAVPSRAAARGRADASPASGAPERAARSDPAQAGWWPLRTAAQRTCGQEPPALERHPAHGGRLCTRHTEGVAAAARGLARIAVPQRFWLNRRALTPSAPTPNPEVRQFLETLQATLRAGSDTHRADRPVEPYEGPSTSRRPHSGREVRCRQTIGRTDDPALAVRP